MNFTQQPSQHMFIAGDMLSQGHKDVSAVESRNGDIHHISKYTWSRYFENYFASLTNISLAGTSNSRNMRRMIEHGENLLEHNVRDWLYIWEPSHPRNNEIHIEDYNIWLQYDYVNDKVTVDDPQYYFERPDYIQKHCDDALEYFRHADKMMSAKYVYNRFFEQCILLQEFTHMRNLRLLLLLPNRTRLPWDDFLHRFSINYNWLIKRHIICDYLVCDEFFDRKNDLIDHDVTDQDFIVPNRAGYKYISQNIWQQLDNLGWIQK